MELYHFPKTLFVAGFIGSPRMNLIPCTFKGMKPEGALIEVEDVPDTPFYANVKAELAVKGALMTLGIRPEDIHLAERGVGVRIEGIERLGTESLLYTILLRGGQSVVVRVPGTIKVEIGQCVNIEIRATACYLFDHKGFAFPRGVVLADLLTPTPYILPEGINTAINERAELSLE